MRIRRLGGNAPQGAVDGNRSDIGDGMSSARRAHMLVSSELQFSGRYFGPGSFKVLGEYMLDTTRLLTTGAQKLPWPVIKVGCDN